MSRKSQYISMGGAMDTIKKFYNIGEVSKICHIPISTLRYYDEIELVIPAKIDDSSGYRYYSNTQLSIIDTITYFRYLNISLKDIKAYLQTPGDNKLLDSLQKKLDSLDDEIRELTMKKSSIQFLQRQLQEILTGPPLDEVFIKKWPKRGIWALETHDTTSNEISKFNYTVRYIHNNLFPHTPVFNDQIGAVFSYKDNIGKDYLQYKYIYLEVSPDVNNVDHIKNIDLPAGEYISIRYRWSPENCIDALNCLHRYLANHAELRIHDDIIEIPIVSGQPGMTGENHVTELQALIIQ